MVQQKVENILTTIKTIPLPVLDAAGSSYAVVDYTMVKSDLFRELYTPFTELTGYAYVLAALERGDGRPALAHWQRFHKQLKCTNRKMPTFPPPRLEAGSAILCGESQGAGRDLECFIQQFEDLSKISIFADVWVDVGEASCACVLSPLSWTAEGR